MHKIVKENEVYQVLFKPCLLEAKRHYDMF